MRTKDTLRTRRHVRNANGPWSGTKECRTCSALIPGTMQCFLYASNHSGNSQSTLLIFRYVGIHQSTLWFPDRLFAASWGFQQVASPLDNEACTYHQCSTPAVKESIWKHKLQVSSPVNRKPAGVEHAHPAACSEFTPHIPFRSFSQLVSGCPLEVGYITYFHQTCINKHCSLFVLFTPSVSDDFLCTSAFITMKGLVVFGCQNPIKLARLVLLSVM